MNHSSEVIERGRSQADRSCYVWGCEGQDLNAQKNVANFVRACETTGDRAANVRRVMTRYTKLKAKGLDPILCFDCSGFVYWACKPFKLFSRRTAAGYYSQTIHKERDELRAGDLVFVHNGSKICHVGLYAGDGMVLHCKGRDVGVVEELISKHGWNRYGRVKGMYDDEPAGKRYVLTKGTLNIRTGPGTEYQSIGVSGKKDRFVWLSDASNGWHEIEYNGGTAWITGKAKYTEVVGA